MDCDFVERDGKFQEITHDGGMQKCNLASESMHIAHGCHLSDLAYGRVLETIMDMVRPG